MNTKFKLLLTTIFFSLLFVVACAPITITPQTHDNIKPLGRLTYIKVEDVKVRKNDQLQVYITLLNSHRKNEKIYYRFKWLDSDGIELGDKPVWKTQIFYGEQTQVIKGVTQDPRAVDFEFEIASDDSFYISN